MRTPQLRKFPGERARRGACGGACGGSAEDDAGRPSPGWPVHVAARSLTRCCSCYCTDASSPSDASQGHEFCFSCIQEWAQRENTCPLCKKRFLTITEVMSKDKAAAAAAAGAAPEAPTAGARGKRKRTRDGKVIGRKVKVKRRDQKNAPSVHTGVMSHFYARAAMVGQRRYVALRRIPATQEGTGEEDYFALLEAPDTDEDEIAEGTGGFLQNFLSRVFSPAGRRAAQREGGGSLGQPIVLEEETAGAAASAPAPAQGRSTSWGTAGTTAEDFILIDDDEDEEEAPIAGQSRVDDTGAIVIVDDEVDKNAADASPGDGGAAAADVITIS